MSKAQEYPKVLAKRVLIKAMQNGDEKMAFEVIKRLEKNRYSEKFENEHSGQIEYKPIMNGSADVI